MGVGGNPKQFLFWGLPAAIIVLGLFSFNHTVQSFNGFGWLVALGFNTILTARAISWWSVMHMCFLAFSHQY